MLLDYVLEQRDVEWYATEDDKVALFTSRFGVPLLDVPQRVYVSPRRDTPPTVRYFVQKLPIFVAQEPAVVSFVWLVTDTSGEAFEEFLNDHVRLLSHLPHWRVIAVAPRHIPGLPACEPALQRVLRQVALPRPAEECDALRTYYQTLDRIERNDLARTSLEDIQRFHDLRRRFDANEFERLFQRWKVAGDAALPDRGATGFIAAIRDGRGALLTDQLPRSYDRFGTRAGVS